LEAIVEGGDVSLSKEERKRIGNLAFGTSFVVSLAQIIGFNTAGTEGYIYETSALMGMFSAVSITYFGGGYLYKKRLTRKALNEKRREANQPEEKGLLGRMIEREKDRFGIGWKGKSEFVGNINNLDEVANERNLRLSKDKDYYHSGIFVGDDIRIKYRRINPSSFLDTEITVTSRDQKEADEITRMIMSKPFPD